MLKNGWQRENRSLSITSPPLPKWKQNNRLLVEMGFLQCWEKSFWRTMHRKMRCNGKIYWSENKRTPPCPRIPMSHPQQVVQLHPAVEEVQPCLHQAQKKCQSPKILCHQFSPFQSLMQFSPCPHLANLAFVTATLPSALLHPSPCLAPCLEHMLAPMCYLAHWMPGPRGSYRERMGKPTNATQTEAFIEAWLYFLRLSNWQVPSWACAEPSS